LKENQTRTLKYGDTFGVFGRNGDIASALENAEGLFYRDTRHLSHLSLSVCGGQPLVLSSALRDDNGALTCDLTNPDLVEGDKITLGQDLIHVRRLKFISGTTCFERVAVRNYSAAKEHVSLAFEFNADFVDSFEIRGATRKKRGTHHPAKVEGDAVTFAYTGLDEVYRATRLRFWPLPDRMAENSAVFNVDLDPHAQTVIFVEVCCDPAPAAHDPRRLFYRSLLAGRRQSRHAASRAAQITTSNDLFNEAIHRARADLFMLNTHLPSGIYPYAGIPWFSTVFGRDGLITAMQTLWFDPSIARGVLGLLAAQQATRLDNLTDAEPGKILHEMRRCEMANTGEVPFGRYYGSIDSTPLFVMLAGAYLKRTGEAADIRQLWPNVLAALKWIDDYGDRDRDGFVEYFRASEDGLVNQGWKDSKDSVFHADGDLADGPIALVEVQAYVYGAKIAAAEIASEIGEEKEAKRLFQEAAALRQIFDVAFWDDALATYVLALDGDKQPCRVRSSNAGHALFTGIALPERVPRLVQTLMDRDSFCGWGIRTISSKEARYNPMSYHNGSIWPHDNSIIARGFAHYGFQPQAAQILEGLFAASSYIELCRLPELFCGFSRMLGQGPTFYPLACAPQAWAAGAILSLVQSCLGLNFDPKRRQVTFERPILPPFLDEITLRELKLAEAKIDVSIRRVNGGVDVNVLGRDGAIDIGAVA
jgi:glycogen debranching enzyme